MRKKVVLSLFITFFSILVIRAQNTIIQSEKSQLYREGLELIDKQQFNAARHVFEAYLALDKNDLKSIEARYYVAVCALNLYHPDGENLIKYFIQNYPYHPKAALAYYAFGNFYFQEKKYTKAIEYYEKIEPGKLDEQQKTERDFKLAYSYLHVKNFDAALMHFDKLRNTDNAYTYAANYYAGYINYRNKAYDQALVCLEKAEENSAYATVVPYMIANIYYKQNSYEQLIDYTSKILKNRHLKNKGEINLLTAEAYYQKQEFEKALPFFEDYTAQTRSKPAPPVLYRIAFTKYKAGQNKDAIEDFKTLASASDSLGQQASYYLGLLYLKEDNKVFAAAAFDKARKNNFNDNIGAEAQYQLGKVNYDMGKFSDAITIFNQQKNQYADDKHRKEVDELLGTAYLHSNNYDQAITHIESLPEKSFNVQKAYQRVTFYKGTEYFNQRKYRKSVAMFKKSLAYPIDKTLVIQAAFWTGEAYSVGRKYEEAIASYKVALSTSYAENLAEYIKAYYGLAYAYYNTQTYDRALVHFNSYIEQIEDTDYQFFYADALIRLADCQYAVKNYSNALSNYDKAIREDNPDKDYAYLQKGIILGIQNKLVEAHQNFDKVISEYTRSSYYDDAIFQKAQLYFEKNNYQSALPLFSKLIHEKPQSVFVPYALMRSAIAHYNLRDYTSSADNYKKIIDVYTSHEVANDALLGLQEVLATENQLDELTSYLAKYKTANPENKNLAIIEFETSKNFYYNQQYEKAISSFESYIQRYSKQNNTYEARFFIAESYYRINQFEEALPYYTEVINDNRSAYINRAIQRKGTIYYKKQQYADAVDHFHDLASMAQNKREQYNAWSGLMKSKYMLAQYDSTDHYARLIIEKGNISTEALSSASLYLGKSHYSRGNYEEAVDAFLKTVNTAKDNNGAEAQYLIAMIFHQESEYTKSIETLYDLNKNFAIYDFWLGKSFLLIAENYIALNEVYQAKATLSSIIEKSPNQEIVTAAKERLRLLEEEEPRNETKEEADSSSFEVEEEK